MTELTNFENKKFLEEKERKLKKEVEKVKTRHDTENNSFQMKMTAAINEFRGSRTVEYERLIQKFKNKFKDLEKMQNKEMNLLTGKSKYFIIYFLFKKEKNLLNKNPKNSGVTSTYTSVLTLNSHTNTYSGGNINTLLSPRSKKKISVLDFKDKNLLKEVKEINNEDKSEVTDINN